MQLMEDVFCRPGPQAGLRPSLSFQKGNFIMRGNKARLSFLALVLACCLAMALSFTTAPSAHAATHSPQTSLLGGLDLKGYCQSLGYLSVKTVGTTYYDWRCIDRNGNNVQFAMRAACQWQYHTLNVIDHTDDFYTATGGKCFGTNGLLGGINARAYCQAHGYADVKLNGNTAYDWVCLGGLFNLNASINMKDACSWMYSNGNVLARFADFYTPTSWQCWA